MAALFLGSFGVSYLIGLLFRRRRSRLPNLTVGASCRLVGPGGVYRSHLESVSRDGLVFSAPLQRDHFVPIRVGEALVVQIPVAEGVVSFRSVVCSRDSDSHTFRLATPTHFRRVERRSEPRDMSVNGQIIALNGSEASLENLSAGGARVTTPLVVKPGERIAVQLGMTETQCQGWALESVPAHLGNQPARSVRVRFEAPLSGLVRR